MLLVVIALAAASCGSSVPVPHPTPPSSSPGAESTAALTPPVGSPSATATAAGTPPAPTTAPSPTPAASPEVVRTPEAVPSASPAPSASSGLRATRLTIPALGIDVPVLRSQLVPTPGGATPGCPPSPPGTTLTVPDQGVATPEEALDGLDNAIWIFGHSRWQNVPGTFLALQDIRRGDALTVDGIDRTSGAVRTGMRFTVDGLYVADIESGTRLVEETASRAPAVILQTSAREDGAGRQWLLPQAQVLARAQNIVPGDLADPCKYLLYFAIAHAS